MSQLLALGRRPQVPGDTVNALASRNWTAAPLLSFYLTNSRGCFRRTMRRDAPKRMPAVGKIQARGKNKAAAIRRQQPLPKSHGNTQRNRHSASDVTQTSDTKSILLPSFWGPTQGLAPRPSQSSAPAPSVTRQSNSRDQANRRLNESSLPGKNGASEVMVRKNNKPSLQWHGGKVCDYDSSDGEHQANYTDFSGCKPLEKSTLSMALDRALQQQEANRAMKQEHAESLEGAKGGRVLPDLAFALILQALRECEEGSLSAEKPREENASDLDLAVPDWYHSLLRDETEVEKANTGPGVWENAVTGSHLGVTHVDSDPAADPKDVAEAGHHGVTELQDLSGHSKLEIQTPVNDDIDMIVQPPQAGLLVDRAIGHSQFEEVVDGVSEMDTEFVGPGDLTSVDKPAKSIHMQVSLQFGCSEAQDSKGDCMTVREGATTAKSKNEGVLQFGSFEASDFNVDNEGAGENTSVQSHCLLLQVEKQKIDEEKLAGKGPNVVKSKLQDDFLEHGSDDDCVGERIDALKVECEVLKEAIEAGELKTCIDHTIRLGVPGTEYLVDHVADSDSDESWSGVELSEVDCDEVEGYLEDDWYLVNGSF